MATLALVLSLFIVALGALGFVAPGRLVAVVRSCENPAGFYAAAALRLTWGSALFVAAPGSRAPDVIRSLSVIIVVAGLATPFFGLERFRKLLDWWTNKGSLFMRLWGGIACGFGVWLAYTVAG